MGQISFPQSAAKMRKGLTHSLPQEDPGSLLAQAPQRGWGTLPGTHPYQVSPSLLLRGPPHTLQSQEDIYEVLETKTEHLSPSSGSTWESGSKRRQGQDLVPRAHKAGRGWG